MTPCINKESDFACVLIATSYLDQILAFVLQKHFVDSEASKKLLNQEGPLGTFGSRSDICYCLGLISKGIYQNLNTIAQILNQFAHNHFMLSFNYSNVSESVRRLRFPRAQGIILEGEQAHGNPEPFSKFEDNSRIRFIVIVAMIVSRLLILGLETKHLDKRTDEWNVQEIT